MEKYNIQSLSKFLEQERTVNELCEWFDNMSDDYDAHKKEVGFSEDEMYKLLDFWLKIQAIYGNQIFNVLSSHWENQKQMIKDFQVFTPKYHEIKYQNILAQMTDTEREEATSLIEEIWEKNQRLEMNFHFYDYEMDSFSDINMSIPRLERENAKSEFSEICANMILNRGHLLVKIYCPRGLVEYTAISVNENGLWYCMDEAEIAAFYSDGSQHPLTMSQNERLIYLKHPLKTKINNYETKFNKYYS